MDGYTERRYEKGVTVELTNDRDGRKKAKGISTEE